MDTPSEAPTETPMERWKEEASSQALVLRWPEKAASRRRTPLTRRTIHAICLDVPTPPSIEPYAAWHAALNIISGIREQLVSFRGDFDQSPDNVHELGSMMVKLEYASYLVDGIRYGLRAAEALTVGPGHALQKLFSSVEQKGGTTIDMVAQLDTVMRTVLNRSDQLIIAHFDRIWFTSVLTDDAPNLGLHTVKRLESVFVETRIANLLMKTAANKNRGYIIGVLEPFTQDAVPPETRQRRQDLMDKNYAALIPVKAWDIVATWTQAGPYIANSLQMIRLFLDPNLMHARGVTMERVVHTLMNLSAGVRSAGNFYAISSSISEGIVDIFPGQLGSASSPQERNAFPQERAERVLLGNTIVMSLDEERMQVSGISNVLSFDVVKVDLIRQINFQFANQHLVAQLGRDAILRANKMANVRWEQFEDLAVLIPREQLDPTDILLGIVGNDYCVVPKDPTPISGARLPSDETITQLLIEQFAGPQGLGNLWCGTLDQLGISMHCLDIQLIEEMLQYCGLSVVGYAQHETLMSRVPGVGILDSIYVRSVLNPKDVMQWHANPDNYQPGNLRAMSAAARQGFQEGDTHLLNLDHYFNYYYAKMKCRKKDSSSKGGSIPNHVESHPYWAVMSYPFVDKDRTVCNDWNTSTYTMGIVAARNNYLMELRHLYSEQSIDRRHLELFGDYVFLNTFPAGIGFHGSKKSGMGAVSLMAIEQSESLLLTEMFNKPVESASNLAVSVLFGMGAEGVAVMGEGSRERTTEMFSQMRREYAYRVRKKYERIGSKKSTVSARTDTSEEEYMELLARFRLIETDPYQSILTFKVRPAVIPSYPANMVPPPNPSKKGAFGMLQRIKAGVDITMALLGRLTPLTLDRNKTVRIQGDFIPMPALYSYIKGVTFYGGTF